MIKKYISQRISYNEFESWLEGKKVVIHAPTGMGKTKFVLEHFMFCCMHKKKKILILCNRRLLQEQYGFDLAELFERYVDLQECVECMTYQNLSEKLKKSKDASKLLVGFDVIIADEAHFFYQDSDFNPFGTYVLLQGLICAGYDKTMIFVTATFEEVRPLLQNSLECVARKLSNMEKFHGDLSQCQLEEDYLYDFSEDADFSHLKCFAVEDAETIWSRIASSPKKSVIFIDNKKEAEAISEELQKNWRIKKEEIYMLNAEIMDEKKGDVVIRTLAIAHRVIPKILITTSVLDNGVSIHDKDVGNIVIATESKISFVQMVGRIRSENCESCNLYVFPRRVSYYERRLEQYEKKISEFEEYEKMIEEEEFFLLSRGWCMNTEEGQMLRNFVIVTREDCEFIQGYHKKIYLRESGLVLAVNQFAREKTGNSLLTIKNFLKLAYEDPMLIAIKQFSWIGKCEKEVQILGSTYLDELKQKLREDLLGIQNVTREEFSEKKVEIARKYQKKLFPEINFNGKSLENQKFEKICEICDMELICIENKREGNRYSVCKKDVVKNERNDS